MPHPVSILTRPGGRVLPMKMLTSDASRYAFQSSPGPGAGCCGVVGSRRVS